MRLDKARVVKQLHDFSKRNAELEADQVRLTNRGEIAEYKKEEEQTKTKLKEVEKEYDNIGKIATGLKSECDNLKNESKETVKKLKAVRAMQQENSLMKNDIKNAKTTISSLQSTINALKSKISILEGDKWQLQRLLDSARREEYSRRDDSRDSRRRDGWSELNVAKIKLKQE